MTLVEIEHVGHHFVLGGLEHALFRSLLETQGGNCGTRSATNCSETETRKVDRTGAHNCRTRMFMPSSLLH
jgi:hypothetical protein